MHGTLHHVIPAACRAIDRLGAAIDTVVDATIDRLGAAWRLARVRPAPTIAATPVHPLLRTFTDEMRAVSIRLIAYGSGLVAVTLAVAEAVSSPPSVAAVEPTARPAWVEVGRPHAAFALAMPELGPAEPRYAIRRHADGNGRKDILAWGAADEPGALMTVEIYRPGAELARFGTAVEEIAGRTHDLGPARGVRDAETRGTKLGPVSLVDFTAQSPAGARRCLGFVRPFAEPRLQISGWYCNPGEEIVDRGLVACALDRLTLLAAGSDPAVAALFARAELKRSFCGHKSPILAATPRRSADWIDTGKDPKLRGRLAGK